MKSFKLGVHQHVDQISHDGEKLPEQDQDEYETLEYPLELSDEALLELIKRTQALLDTSSKYAGVGEQPTDACELPPDIAVSDDDIASSDMATLEDRIKQMKLKLSEAPEPQLPI